MSSSAPEHAATERRACLALFLSATFALSLLSAHAAPAPPDARAIMQGVYQQDTSRDTALRATMDVSDSQGQTLRKRFVLLKKGSLGNSKTLVRFTDPAELRGVTLLSINQSGATASQWIYLPATDRVRSVAPRERSERFVGSDLTYEDVAEPVLDDFTYQLLSEDEVMDGHKTYKLEATPVSADRSQYKFVYYWVAQDLPIILHAEKYDQQGRLVRTLHASQLKKVSGFWGARRLEMGSILDGTRTVLTIDGARFNTDLADSQFDPDSLGKSH